MKAFKLQFIKDKLGDKGAATLLIVSILSIVFVMLSVAMARTNLVRFKTFETAKNSRHSYYLAETGIEETLYQVMQDTTYTGNPSGEVTPVGTFYTEVDYDSNIADITAFALERETKRSLNLNISLIYEAPKIATKAMFMADFFWISGEGARIRGDVWTNDDFDVVEHGVVEGNLHSAGKGSFAVNWVWDGINGGNPELQGGEVLDNPATADIAEGNIFAADDVKVSGPTAYVQGDVTSEGYVWELFGGTINGNIYDYQELEWDLIPVPDFDFDMYEEQAVTLGTHYANANGFLNYLESIDDGNERRLPENLYYIKNGALKVPSGSSVYLEGMIVVEDNFYIYTEWHQIAQDGLPAIISGKTVYIENKWNIVEGKFDGGGPVRINGIVFAENDLKLSRTYEDEDIIIVGAGWAGDDIFVGTHTYIEYDIDPLNVQGFGFETGLTDVEKNTWEETVD